MKKLTLTLIILLIAAGSLFAQANTEEHELFWEYDTTYEGLKAYEIWIAENDPNTFSENNTIRIDAFAIPDPNEPGITIPVTSYKIDLEIGSTYYFKMKTIADVDEGGVMVEKKSSGFSNGTFLVISLTPPPPEKVGIR